ncbi:MAG TPA: carbamoyltransferase HypF [Gallionella sp.]|nr:MAG: carbamoyltransferase HypF [Gallionellales bacterium GWA2_54_124]HCI52416.1 carbamoyltransferase HypF [Gallionella sp.]
MPKDEPAGMTVCAKISVSGQVQGVGFRPFVYRLAHELDLAGWVRNDSCGVEISVEGERESILSLIARLKSEPPSLARIEQVSFELTPPVFDVQGFSILASRSGVMQTSIAPDMAICPDCIAELFNPADRRYRHAFINCIHCGPRYTLIRRLPYDRANTSMEKFAQCPACQREYDDPATRRFHAQPNACQVCGPTLKLYGSDFQPVETEDPLVQTAGLLRTGQIVAIKGIGGFHLVCMASNQAAVNRLRALKQRDEKPFAVMVLNTRSAQRYATVSAAEAFLLETGERPIVLLGKRPACDEDLFAVAPDLSHVGMMLPYTPLHYLLFHDLLGCPDGTGWLQQASPIALVMTSANAGGEPLVINDDEARASRLADGYLTHDREILHRCDDSVMRVVPPVLAPKFQFIRRARGYTPRRILLPFAVPSVLALGSGLKNTVCVTRGNEAFVSQHIGDLDHAGARAMLDETVTHLCDLFDIEPQCVAHDLHPDCYTSQYAARFAAARGVPTVAVQHHHAHINAICAEHGVSHPVLGLALDGAGWGADGTSWGGELLRVSGAQFERLGHLAAVELPGGDRAAREPWRMASAALFEMGKGAEIAQRFSNQPAAPTVAAMLARGLHCPQSSSMGRLFDTAAGLLGVSQIQSYEGQAAMRLEALAIQYGEVEPLAGGYRMTEAGVLDFHSLLGQLAGCNEAAFGAALFHATIARGLIAWVSDAAQNTGIGSVALGGGCLLNSLLSEELTSGLSKQGLKVLTAQLLPPNDGGISLGQAWVAAQSDFAGRRVIS